LFLLTLVSPVYWLYFSHLAYRSAVRDVLANFLRLPKSQSLVNFFFRIILKPFGTKHLKRAIVRAAQKSQKIVTITRSRSTQLLHFIQLQWLGFGYRAAIGSKPVKRLDCAPSSLYNLPIYFRAKVRSFASLPIQSTVLFDSLQALRFCDFLRLAALPNRCNPPAC